jgi:hypothetical protein
MVPTELAPYAFPSSPCFTIPLARSIGEASGLCLRGPSRSLVDPLLSCPFVFESLWIQIELVLRVVVERFPIAPLAQRHTLFLCPFPGPSTA